MLNAFDHVNIRTAHLQAMVDWYGEILGLRPGWRPPFPFGGAWLYLGEQAIVHLVEVPHHSDPGPDAALRLEHFAFRAQDRPGFCAGLEARGIAFTVDPVPGTRIVQINLHDVDGNHIHVDFEDPPA